MDWRLVRTRSAPLRDEPRRTLDADQSGTQGRLQNNIKVN